MKRLKATVGICLMALVAWSLVGCSSGAKKRSEASYKITKIIKPMIKSLRDDFQQGTAERVRTGRFDRPDARMSILAYQLQKLRRNITSRLKDPQRKATALSKLKEANDFMNSEIIPKHLQARRTKDPEQIKALVPLMDKLEQYMDEILDAIQ